MAHKKLFGRESPPTRTDSGKTRLFLTALSYEGRALIGQSPCTSITVKHPPSDQAKCRGARIVCFWTQLHPFNFCPLSVVNRSSPPPPLRCLGASQSKPSVAQKSRVPCPETSLHAHPAARAAPAGAFLPGMLRRALALAQPFAGGIGSLGGGGSGAGDAPGPFPESPFGQYGLVNWDPHKLVSVHFSVAPNHRHRFFGLLGLVLISVKPLSPRLVAGDLGTAQVFLTTKAALQQRTTTPQQCRPGASGLR